MMKLYVLITDLDETLASCNFVLAEGRERQFSKPLETIITSGLLYGAAILTHRSPTLIKNWSLFEASFENFNTQRIEGISTHRAVLKVENWCMKSKTKWLGVASLFDFAHGGNNEGVTGQFLHLLNIAEGNAKLGKFDDIEVPDGFEDHTYSTNKNLQLARAISDFTARIRQDATVPLDCEICFIFTEDSKCNHDELLDEQGKLKFQLPPNTSLVSYEAQLNNPKRGYQKHVDTTADTTIFPAGIKEKDSRGQDYSRYTLTDLLVPLRHDNWRLSNTDAGTRSVATSRPVLTMPQSSAAETEKDGFEFIALPAPETEFIAFLDNNVAGYKDRKKIFLLEEKLESTITYLSQKSKDSEPEAFGFFLKRIRFCTVLDNKNDRSTSGQERWEKAIENLILELDSPAKPKSKWWSRS